MANQSKNLKQNKASNKNHNNRTSPPDTKIIYLLPMIFVIAILPFIVKLREYSTPLSQYKWFTENGVYYDFFLYYKQTFLIAAAIIMFAFILYKVYNDKQSIHFTKTFIPLGIYALLVFLSSVISEYRSFSFTGTFEQFESLFAILAYCLLVYYAYQFIRGERDLKYILYALLISVILLCLLGFTQISEHDFYQSNIGWNLISTTAYRNHIDAFNFVMEANRVYLSFYNPNYVGMYVALVLPIMLFMALFTKKLWLRLIYLSSVFGLIVCLYGSKSTAGLVGIVIAIALSVVLLWRYLMKYYYISIPVIIIIIAALFIVNAKTNNYFGMQFEKLTNIQKSEPVLTEIQTNDDNIVIKYNGNTLKVIFVYDEATGFCSFVFKDENDFDIPYTYETVNGPAIIIDPRYPDFVFTPTLFEDIIGFSVPISGNIWNFTNQAGDNTYYYINRYGRLDKMITAPSAIFTGYERYASGRGYIWSRTIPLLKNKILLGSGADTFSIVFPQSDYVNMYNYGYQGQLMSKPHSLYLQIAVQSGVLSLIAFLVFYGMYFFSSLRIYIKGHFQSIYMVCGAAILCGTLGYMVTGISNDSTITVSPIFWLLIGIGLAVNQKAKQEL